MEVALVIFIFIILCHFFVMNNMAEEDGNDLAFREPSNGGIDLNVIVSQKSRDYSEYFRMYKFWVYHAYPIFKGCRPNDIR